MKKPAASPKVTCATTAGYVYQAWPKGKPTKQAATKRKMKRRR